MKQEIKEKILSTLKKLKLMLKSGTVISSDLKKLGNSIIEDVSLFQDQDSISIAVLVHSLYKIFTKNEHIERKQLLTLLNNTIKSINIEPQFRRNIRLLFDRIKKYDKNIDTNIIELIKHAQIKKGLRVYEHGLSIGQAAEIIGISKWDIIDYLGTTDIVDRDPNAKIDQKTRLDFARGLFK